jgi:hypothetical protein
MSDTDRKIDEMHGMIHSMKPVLESVREDQRAFELRLRGAETTATEHKVKIERIQDDLDGLGRKVRSYPVADAALRGEPRGGKWLAFLEFMAVLPQYWHVVLSLGMTVVAALTIVWHHFPKEITR